MRDFFLSRTCALYFATIFYEDIVLLRKYGFILEVSGIYLEDLGICWCFVDFAGVIRGPVSCTRMRVILCMYCNLIQADRVVYCTEH